MVQLLRAPCHHDYPCSCVMYQGLIFRGADRIIDFLEEEIASLKGQLAAERGQNRKLSEALVRPLD